MCKISNNIPINRGNDAKLSPNMFEANTVSMSCGNWSNSELMFSNTKLHTPPLQAEDGTVADIALDSKFDSVCPRVKLKEYDVVDSLISSNVLQIDKLYTSTEFIIIVTLL